MYVALNLQLIFTYNNHIRVFDTVLQPLKWMRLSRNTNELNAFLLSREWSGSVELSAKLSSQTLKPPMYWSTAQYSISTLIWVTLRSIRYSSTHTTDFTSNWKYTGTNAASALQLSPSVNKLFHTVNKVRILSYLFYCEIIRVL